MRRYTTPTQVLTCKGVDLTGCNVWVTYSQGLQQGTVTPANNVCTIRADALTVESDGTDTTIEVPLTQLQTARFATGRANVQVNWMDSDNVRGATNIGHFTVDQNLLEMEVSYAD